jgi:cytochrome c oxidase subunit III
MPPMTINPGTLMAAEAHGAPSLDAVDAAREAHAARFGMWIFLATEVLLFGGLFAGYAMYRALYPLTFAECSRHLDRASGTLDTLVLITSSFTMAMGHHFVQRNRSRAAAVALGATIALGLTFLAIHGHEYMREIGAGEVPGRLYHGEVTLPGAGMFFTVYFFLTGLHSLHVLIGAGLIAWLLRRVIRGDFSPTYDTPLELGGLYWHFIDLVWIVLYPLLYLI